MAPLAAKKARSIIDQATIQNVMLNCIVGPHLKLPNCFFANRRLSRLNAIRIGQGTTFSYSNKAKMW
jgi:hypothetical protein